MLALCDSIDEIYDELIHNLNKNQTKIIEETNQIIINIPTDDLKIKEILFVVYEKIKNDKETINELLSIISNLKEEINDLKTNKIENINEKINNLEKENKEFKKDNSTLNEKVNNLESKINNLEKENKEFKNQNSKLNEKINNLEIENKEFKKDNSKLTEKINNLEKEFNSKLNEKINNLEKEFNSKLNEKINNLESKINNLEKENKENKNQNSRLNEKINNLEKENKEFKKDNSKLNEKINNLEKEFNSKLNEKINNLEKENEILKQYLPYLEQYKKKQDEIKIKIKNLDSLIIENNIKYNKTLKNWIDPNIKIKSELLYRMSRDGIECSKFHNLCDNKGATITLIKLEDGNILGNYTPLSWDSTSNWKNDLKMFVFNLTENIKCIKNNQDSDGIYCDSNYGPYTDVIWFYYGNKMNNPYIYPNRTEYNECNKIYSKSKGYYKSVEVEVFKIILD